jgi:Zn-dependent protease
MTGTTLKLAVYVAIALLPALVLHEYAHAFVATRLGDPTPKRWGRLTLNPRPLIDPFGSLILPALSLILIATGNGLLIPIFAYAKPLPLDPTYLRNRDRDTILIALAGLGMNVLLAVAGGILVRAGVSGELRLFAQAWLIVNALMFGFQLMPIPGLDGSRLLARALPPRPREIYTNLDQYLVLFILVVFFLLAGPLQAIVRAFGNVVCNLAAGVDCL